MNKYHLLADKVIGIAGGIMIVSMAVTFACLAIVACKLVYLELLK